MPDQIYIGNYTKGQTTNRLPFNIDNDAFPNLYNFYVWRGRAKRKRGTLFLGQLQRQIQFVQFPNQWQVPEFSLSSGAGNLISQFNLGSSASIVVGTISILGLSDGTTYTDPNQDGTLTATGGTGTGGTINYATGDFTITSGGGQTVTGSFSYYPGLPVLGLEDFDSALSSNLYPLLLSFDTQYSYQLNQSISPPTFYSTSYYKSSSNPVIWSGSDYQQFWTANYSGALWATNNNPGFHFVNATYVSGSGTTSLVFNFKSSAANYTSLQIGDQVWFNEFGSNTINGTVGTVSDKSSASTGNYTLTFVTSVTASGVGIGQLLTASIPGQDGIRWYDGDQTGLSGLPTSSSVGWVNFAPPLTGAVVSIDNSATKLWYLVGALAILPFKDRLLFFNPTIQASTGASVNLQDTVIWSWNGTPYYASLVPSGQTSNVIAYYVDQTGAGGYLPAGLPQPIVTISNNEDVLLIGFGGDGRKTRFAYTGNDLQPFLFYNINSELPSSATFSAVALDKGAIDIGQYGIALTDQQSSARIDLQIPDSVFQIQALNNGAQRVNAVRDFYKEWIYFCYPTASSSWKFPTQTFLFNYRDNTWSILYENFTKHGTYRPQKKKTWANVGFPTWESWREPWNSGSSSPQFPSIVAGNPQGFVLIKGQGTSEGNSGTISAVGSVASSAALTQITSVNHCVAPGDYLYITGCLGTTALNTQIGMVTSTIDANNFVIDLPFPPGTYLGLGQFARLSQPFLQTKQFAPYWEQGKQVRLGVQKFLMDTTANAQVTVNIYLSQDPDDAWNDPANAGGPSNGLVFSQIMFTCPESTNLGLTPFNTNLNMPIASEQYQIWHRTATSLIGNSFQVGITLSDSQMRNLTYATSEVTCHAMQFDVSPSALLA